VEAHAHAGGYMAIFDPANFLGSGYFEMANVPGGNSTLARIIFSYRSGNRGVIVYDEQDPRALGRIAPARVYDIQHDVQYAAQKKRGTANRGACYHLLTSYTQAAL
jgi:hypothetical protein